MRISETTLSFLEADCRQIFGEPAGAIIFQQTEKIYQELLHSADDRGSAAIREHLQLKLFPPMAYYKALRANGFCQEEALSYVRRETQRAAAVKKEQMGKLARLPFAYTLYRMGVKKHMKKNFPDEGWQTEWVRCDGRKFILTCTAASIKISPANLAARSCAVSTAKMTILPFPA